MSLHEMMSQHRCGFVSGPVGGASARVREAPRARARAGVLRGACNERGSESAGQGVESLLNV